MTVTTIQCPLLRVDLQEEEVVVQVEDSHLQGELVLLHMHHKQDILSPSPLIPFQSFTRMYPQPGFPQPAQPPQGPAVGGGATGAGGNPWAQYAAAGYGGYPVNVSM